MPPTVTTPRPENPSKRTIALIAIGMFIATFLVFSRSLANDFVGYDDPKYVANNHHVMRGLTAENVAWALTTDEFASWMPLTWLSHIADVQLFGLHAWGHHATSVALFAASVAVLFVTLNLATNNLSLSAVATMVFAFHPLRVQSVAWIAERKDVLSLLFGLLALLSYVIYARRPSAGRYAMVLACAALSLMSKSVWVTLPAVLILWDVWPLRRWNRESARRLILEKVPLVVLSLIVAGLTYQAQRHSGSITTGEAFSPAQRLANAPISYVRYLMQFVWPARLAVYYPHPGDWPVAAVGVSIITLAAITAAAYLRRQRTPQLLIGWLWFLGTLGPMIGIVQVGSQSIADRYTLVPSIGLTIAVVWLLGNAIDGRRAVAMAGVIAIALAVRTVVEIGYWRDTYTLFTRALEVTGDNSIAEGFVGSELVRMKRESEGLPHLIRALELNPNYAEVHYNLGNLFMRHGQTAQAMEQFETATRLMPNLALAQNNLGVLYAGKKDFENARQRFEAATKADPDWPDGHFSLANALAAMGRRNEAISELQIVLRLQPNHASARRKLADLQK